MDSLEVESYLEDLSSFRGVFPRDMLPKIRKKPFCIVCNTDKNNEPGTHWVAIIALRDKTQYFDSFGLPPLIEDFRIYLNSLGKPVEYNKWMIQDSNSSMCGGYCIAFIKERCRGRTYRDFIELFDMRDTIKNEATVKRLLSTYK